jgi:hypothetical protein
MVVLNELTDDLAVDPRLDWLRQADDDADERDRPPHPGAGDSGMGGGTFAAALWTIHESVIFDKAAEQLKGLLDLVEHSETLSNRLVMVADEDGDFLLAEFNDRQAVADWVRWAITTVQEIGSRIPEIIAAC